MKMLIPRMNTFKYDEFFMHADYVLHIGADPWRIVHSFLGYPALTAIISFLYGLWLPVFFLVLYWQMFRLKNPQLRMQFFYTFALTWAVNGTLVAMLLPAAGPCFYKLVLQSDYYKPLMDYLYEVNKTLPIHAVTTQEMLWRNYTETERITGGGISAFPSVHVATAFLYVLVGYRSNKWIYALCIAFFTVILLGSVHLGWHYAVDGYFAILSTYALWWGAGKFLKWRKTKAGAF